MQVLVSWARYTLILAIPALSLLYVKYLLIQKTGMAKVAACCALQLDPAQAVDWESSTPWWIRVSFYRRDLLFVGVFLPLFVLVFLLFLPRRIRAVGLGLLSTLLFLVLMVQIRVFWTSGRFLSLGMAREALQFASTTGGALSAYIDGSFIWKSTAGMFATGCITWWVTWRERRMRRGIHPRRAEQVLLALPFGALLMAMCISWLPNACSNGCSPGVAALLFRSICESQVSPDEFAQLSDEQLVKAYRDLTRTPEPIAAPAHWGKAKGCDIVIFVMETAPLRCFETSVPSHLPNWERLRQRAWLGREHLTTATLSRQAHFSILTSWYPSPCLNDFPRQFPDRSFPGLMQSLRTAGYETAAYVPDPYTRAADEDMHEKLGLRRRVYTGEGKDMGDLGTRIRNDRAAFNQMRQDIARWNAEGQRFAAVFLPQIGHGPWLDVDGNIPPTDMLARGRAIIALQDAWLGELLKLLEPSGKLENTLIVVTGDHGVRTTMEDPRTFNAGMIQEYSFHVPFLLYAPTVLTSPQEIPWTTSHIDICPSLLDLLGISEGRTSEQGAPIWDSRLAERTVFLWGRIHVGADGFKGPSGCGMWHPLFDNVYAADTLAFDPAAPCMPSDGRFGMIKQTIQRMEALQEAWARRSTQAIAARP